jgi:hypothetical protein
MSGVPKYVYVDRCDYTWLVPHRHHRSSSTHKLAPSVILIDFGVEFITIPCFLVSALSHLIKDSFFLY